MNNENENGLKKLLSKFFDSGQAERVFEDIRSGDEIFDAHPVPAPDEAVAELIKKNIPVTLREHRSTVVRSRLYEFAAVAAMIVVVIFAGRRIFINSGNIGKPVISQAQQTVDIFTDEDAELETFEDEIDQLQNELLSLGEEEINLNGSEDAITEMEMEFIEIETTFWKG